MGSPGSGAARIGTEERTSLSCFNAASASSVHVNLSTFFSNLYSGRAFSPSRLTNRLTAATQPVSRWMSFRHVGRFMFKMALIFSGLTSIPHWETMKPNSLSAGTPKTHFLGLIYKGSHRPDLYSRQVLGLQGKVLAGQVTEFYTVYY